MNIDELKGNMRLARAPAWLVVPVISFGGIVLGMLFSMQDNPILSNPGVIGCIAASFILGIIAYLKPKKDLVALLAPMYAVIIFNPYTEFETGLVMQLLYALTITGVGIRLEKRFSKKPQSAIE
ncbi:MAG: hypothetical protein RQ758_06705 [Methanomicrobiaceae archaeon]|nr:hypothetical protein [Methanomicrobiaceae archaeon]